MTYISLAMYLSLDVSLSVNEIQLFLMLMFLYLCCVSSFLLQYFCIVSKILNNCLSAIRISVTSICFFFHEY